MTRPAGSPSSPPSPDDARADGRTGRRPVAGTGLAPRAVRGPFPHRSAEGRVPGVRDAEGRGDRVAAGPAVGRALLRIRDGPPRRPPLPPLLPGVARGPQGWLERRGHLRGRVGRRHPLDQAGARAVRGRRRQGQQRHPGRHGALLAQLLPDARHAGGRAEGRTLQGPGRDVRRAAWSRSSRRTGCAGASSAKRR